MKVVCNGKEMFEFDIPEEIPEVIEINEDTQWGDKWGLFAILALLDGHIKFNEEYLKEVKEKELEKQKTACLQASEEDILKLQKNLYNSYKKGE